MEPEELAHRQNEVDLLKAQTEDADANVDIIREEVVAGDTEIMNQAKNESRGTDGHLEAVGTASREEGEGR